MAPRRHLQHLRWDVAERRFKNPIQTFKDEVLRTRWVEDLSGIEAILVEGGELKRDGPFCGKEAECITGVRTLPGSQATTTGHTLRFRGKAPDRAVVAHETQHAYDLESVGSLPFYLQYLVEYGVNRAGGDSHREAYHDISWERRGFAVDEGYPAVQPCGWPCNP